MPSHKPNNILDQLENIQDIANNIRRITILSANPNVKLDIPIIFNDLARFANTLTSSVNIIEQHLGISELRWRHICEKKNNNA